MKALKIITAITVTLAGSLAIAAAPILHVSKSVTIDAPADKVWSTVKDFNGWTAWHPALATDEIVEGTNNKPGAVRLLTLKGGGTIKERLLAQNEAAHSVKYAILDGVLPVSAYTSHLVVKSKGPSKSVVTWSGEFKRKDTGDQPSDKENDSTATQAVTGVYQSGLDNLKKVVEGK